MVWAIHERQRLGTDVIDVLLLCLVWPLYLPLLWLRTANGGDGAGTPAPSISGLLGHMDGAAALSEQMARARQNVKTIDALLMETEFNREHAHWHKQKLMDAGQTQAALRVDARLANIERLHTLRSRYAEQLAEIEELVVQLRLQAAVVRLSGRDDESRQLMDALVARVQSLDVLMEEGML